MADFIMYEAGASKDQVGMSKKDVMKKMGEKSYDVGELHTHDGQVFDDFYTVQEKIDALDKKHLLALRGEGYKVMARDTRDKNQKVIEYHKFLFTLSKQESAKIREKFSDEQINNIFREAIIDLKNEPQGQRNIYLTPVHFDTGNLHIQGFLGKFMVDHNQKVVPAGIDLCKPSPIQKIAERIRTHLLKYDINLRVVPIKETKEKKRVDYHADRDTPEINEEVKDLAAADLEEAGVRVTPDYDHGTGPARPEQPALSPDREIIQKRKTRLAKKHQDIIFEMQEMDHVDAAFAERDEALQNLHDTKTELTDTQEKLTATENELSNTWEKLAATETDLASMQEKNLDLEAALSGTKESLAEKIQEHDSLAEEFNTLYEDAQGLEKQLKATETDLNSTKTELNNTRAELAGTQTELDDTRTELDSTKTELAGTQEKLTATETDLADTRTELDSTKARLADLERALIAEQQQRQQAETQLESVKMQITAERETFSTVKSELRETISELKSDKTELKTEIAALTAENDSLKESLKSAKALNETYEAENEGLKQQLESGKGQDLEQE